MKRLTFTSLLLEARDLDGTVTPGERESHRGDEHLCAVCGERPGTRYDAEARLVCTRCDRRRN